MLQLSFGYSGRVSCAVFGALVVRLDSDILKPG